MAFLTKVFNTIVWYDFNPTWNFSTDFTKNLECKISRKLVQGGVELYRADWRMDGRTNMTKMILTFWKIMRHIVCLVYWYSICRLSDSVFAVETVQLAGWQQLTTVLCVG